TAGPVGPQRPRAGVLAPPPGGFDPDIFPLAVAGIAQTPAGRSRLVPGGIPTPPEDKSDHRHPGLLRVRHERPRSRAAEKRDELTASHAEHRASSPLAISRRG